MGKKIFFAITGGLALCGLAVAIVGFALGGRPGGFVVSDGQLTFYNSNESVALANVPSWWRWSTGWDGSWPWNHGKGGNHSNSAAGVSTSGEAVFVPAAQTVKAVDIKISGGYLNIVTGSEPGLTVEGPMVYESSLEDSVWTITSSYKNLSVRNQNGQQRFYHNGQDITTIFTLTLPETLSTLATDTAQAIVNIHGFTLNELSCRVDMGTLKVLSCTVNKASFNLAMGEMDITGLDADDCTLDCDMGAIYLEGNVRRRLTADCDMGDITALLARPATYGWKADAGMGNIEIDDQTIAEGLGASSSGNADVLPFFDLDCNMGNIEINFSGR